ncbi:MAG: TetR/AcrR family transcriptional regulator [Pseudomonadota bacterium]
MRRLPRQQRSRELVSRLLDATAAVVVERGVLHTTTNHIAEKAGVSIGSLYQYFPDKEALLEALLERISQDIGSTFRAQANNVDFTRYALRDVTKMGLTLGIGMIRNDPLMRELVQNWNHVPVHKVLDPLEQFFTVMAQPYFLRNRQDYPVKHLEAKLYVLINSALFTSIRYLLQDPPPISEKAFINAMTDMVVALLEGPDRPAAAAPA